MLYHRQVDSLLGGKSVRRGSDKQAVFVDTPLGSGTRGYDATVDVVTRRDESEFSPLGGHGGAVQPGAGSDKGESEENKNDQRYSYSAEWRSRHVGQDEDETGQRREKA